LGASFSCLYLLNTMLINSFRFLQPTTLLFSIPSVPKAFTACLGTTHVLSVTNYEAQTLLRLGVSWHQIRVVSDTHTTSTLIITLNYMIFSNC